MRTFKVLLSAFIGLMIFSNCGNDPKKNHQTATALTPIYFLQPEKNVLVSGDSVIIKKNPAITSAIDSIQIFWAETFLKTSKVFGDQTFSTVNLPLGIRDLSLKVYLAGQLNTQNIQFKIVSDITPITYTHQVISELTHNEKSFTEGLEFDNDILLESTGLNGTSEIKTIDNKGAEAVRVKLEDHYFGEGITKLDNYIYQLTWRENAGFVYDSTFKRVATFMFDTEGWGMSNDGVNLLRSDGSNTIYVTDKNSFTTLRTIQVYDGANALEDINELEYVNGFIYANIWKSDSIVKIDAATGKVLAYLDLSSLRKKLKNTQAEVLNGIAYHAQKKLWYVTGKYWDKLFAIKVLEKPAKSQF